MSSLNLFISSQLCSNNAAEPTHDPTPRNASGICAPADHIGAVVAFAGFLPFCFSGLRVSPGVLSSLNLFISPQLCSNNAADPTHTPLLSAILQEYALRRVFYQKKRAFSCNSQRRKVYRPIFLHPAPTRSSRSKEAHRQAPAIVKCDLALVQIHPRTGARRARFGPPDAVRGPLPTIFRRDSPAVSSIVICGVSTPSPQ